MNATPWILGTLIVYKIILIAIGVWASRRTQNTEDFFIGGRKLGPWVAAISASASSSSAWTLLGVSGAAYAWGLAAAWLIPACLMGFVINWFIVAPRIYSQAKQRNCVTLTEYLVGSEQNNLKIYWVRSASFMIIISFIFYIAAQFQASGTTFAATFDMNMNQSILIGGIIIIVYTMIGGFWAVSLTDTLQGLMMALTSVLLPIGALIAVGGPSELFQQLTSLQSDTLRPGMTASIFFIAGTLGIGLGYPGQPHVVNRLMALKDKRSLKRGTAIAISWAVLVYIGMVLLGWCGRVLFSSLPDTEQIFIATARQTFPPVIFGVMIASVLSAIMSTADSQILVAASSLTYDLNQSKSKTKIRLLHSRAVVLGVSILAILLALFASQSVFSRVLFAWHALGSAFGPIVLFRVFGHDIQPKFLGAAMWSGFLGTVFLHLLPNSQGDFLERLVPFFIALFLCFLGKRSV